jgi:hypothetical protein
MPAQPIGHVDIKRFLRALAASGTKVESVRGAKPWTLRLHGAPELVVYMWPLRAARYGYPRRRRVGLHRRGGGPFRRRPDAITLLLGYAREEDLYVGWSVRRFGDAAPNSSAWVDERVLRRALADGFAHDPERGAVAFRPDFVGTYLMLEGLFDVGGGTSLRHGASLDTVTLGDTLLAVPGDRIEEDRSPPRRRSEDVETGFSHDTTEDSFLAPPEPLAPGERYLFRFAVGIDSGRSAETEPSPLPVEKLPHKARLTVQLFEFDGELAVEGRTHGELELTPEGGIRVTEPAEMTSDEEGMRDRTLFFVVSTPETPGDHRLRCNVYHGSTLVQSRLVTAQVGGDRLPGGGGFRSDLDYSLTGALDVDRVARVPDHRLSITVNGDGDTHEFRFFSDHGDELFAATSTVDSATVGGAIDAGREALQMAAWGKPAEWDEKTPYRYPEDHDRDQFKDDLIALAVAGYRLFFGIGKKLAGGSRADRDKLAEIAREPGGAVQLAITEGGLYLPLGLFYDHPLDTDPQAGEAHRICPDFLADLYDVPRLEESRCFDPGCAHRDDLLTVCPSGFWGYAHRLGTPVRQTQIETELVADGDPELAIGVSTDPNFALRDDHVDRVRTLGRSDVAESREELTELLRKARPHLVYLYCHGGVKDGTPYVQLGEPGDDATIDETYFGTHKLKWEERRPVVFINGCHTTAMDPKQLLSLVGGFVEEGNALGVIGTEITIFEPLACAFAEPMLESFLDGSETVGEAVRRARLKLLKERNPLGLVYVPFVAAPTRLVREGSAA